MENKITIEDFKKLLSTMNEEEKKATLDFWDKKHKEYLLNHVALFQWEFELILDIKMNLHYEKEF